MAMRSVHCQFVIAFVAVLGQAKAYLLESAQRQQLLLDEATMGTGTTE